MWATVAEAVLAHNQVGKGGLEADLVALVKSASPISNAAPDHPTSRRMRQRVMIAMAINRPRLLIADGLQPHSMSPFRRRSGPLAELRSKFG